MLLWSALLIPLQMLVLLFRDNQAAMILPRLWHRGTCRLYGIKVNVTGAPPAGDQTLYVCNHISYLDITAIGSVLKCSFIAKSEVAGWPFFGLLAKLQKTAFISRNPRAARESGAKIAQRLAAGHDLVLFAEGTSSNGETVLPFRSSLFETILREADNRNIRIQPLTLRITALDGGKAVTADNRDLYAWHGAMTLPPHLWAFAKSKGAALALHFHAPVDISRFSDRKTLAKHCHNVVLGPINEEKNIQKAREKI